jgi:hypothetical protein
MRNFVRMTVVCGLAAALFPAAARAQYGAAYYSPQVVTPATYVYPPAPVVVNRYSFYTPVVTPAPVVAPVAYSTTVVQRPILRPRVSTTYYYGPGYATGYYAAPATSYYVPATTYYYPPGYYSYYYTPGFFRY